jgi:hypothetical protein
VPTLALTYSFLLMRAWPIGCWLTLQMTVLSAPQKQLRRFAAAPGQKSTQKQLRLSEKDAAGLLVVGRFVAVLSWSSSFWRKGRCSGSHRRRGL